MSKYKYKLALLILVEHDERVNDRLYRNGYGPDNVKRECIGINDADGASATHLCGTTIVTQQDVDSMPYLLGFNDAVKYNLTGRDDDALTPLLTSNNLRLKSISEEI